MKEITLKKLTLENFKGLKDLTIDFNDKVTNIRGKNRAGKSTLVNAFLWLLFGKDSDEKSDFEIKTYDEKGVITPKIDHRVTGLLDIDGTHKELSRNYKEVWGTVRGEEEIKLKSHTTEYSVDELTALKEKEYKTEISSIIDEEVFKLITNPTYFNSDKYGWQKRREMIFKLVSSKPDNELLDQVPYLQSAAEKEYMQSVLNSNADLNDHKRGLTSQINKLNDKISIEIPAQIKEVERQKPEEIDFAVIESQISDIKKKLTSIDEKIIDRNKANESLNKSFQDKQNQLFDLKRELSVIENTLKDTYNAHGKEEKRKLDTLNFEIKEIEDSINLRNRSIDNLNQELISLGNQRNGLLKDWESKNAEKLTIDENQFNCPRCKRPFEADDIETKRSELAANFNTNKISVLQGISERGKRIKSQIEETEKKITDLKDEIKKQQDKIPPLEVEIGKIEKIMQQPREAFESVLLASQEYQSKKSTIEVMEKSLEQRPPLPDISDLTEEKEGLNEKLDELKAELLKKDRISESVNRVKELEQEGKQIAQQIADLKRKKNAIQEFTRFKINLLEEQVNKCFKFTKFKMFEEQMNGDINNQMCTAIAKFNGVPYPTLNSEAQLNVGIDCINAISDHFGVRAPIWIDGRESVTNIIDTESQVINLIVDPSCETLTIEK